MRSFLATRPAGAMPRWITHLRLGQAGTDLGDAYAATARDWWAGTGDRRSFEQVLHVLPPPLRHITLAPLDLPAEHVDPCRLQRLTETITARLASTDPVKVVLGPAIVNTVAVELYLVPNPALTALRDHVVAAIHDVVGTEVGSARPWRAHSSFAYCHDDFDDTGLQSALLRAPGPAVGYQVPITTRIDHVLLVTEDTWAPAGLAWELGTARCLPLGAPSATGPRDPRG